MSHGISTEEARIWMAELRRYEPPPRIEKPPPGVYWFKKARRDMFRNRPFSCYSWKTYTVSNWFIGEFDGSYINIIGSEQSLSWDREIIVKVSEPLKPPENGD